MVKGAALVHIVPTNGLCFTAHKDTGKTESVCSNVNGGIGLICAGTGLLDSMVVILEGCSAVLDGALEKGGTVVDILLHRNAAGGGGNLTVLGPAGGTGEFAGSPGGVCIPVGYSVGIVGCFVSVIGNTYGAVAIVQKFCREQVLVDILRAAAHSVCGN